MCPCLHPPCACLRKQQSRLLGAALWVPFLGEPVSSRVPFCALFSFLDSCLRRKDTHWIPACAGMTHEAGLSTAREEAKVPLTRPACRFLAVAALAGLSRRGRGELVFSPLVGEG